MCGICGEIRFMTGEATTTAVERMSEVLAPRGPDAEACFKLDGVALGHRRLKLIDLASHHAIPVRREVFRYYRSDAATAVDAGNDIRTALAAFGVDASHGWERTHVEGLLNLARLIALYMQSEPTFERDKLELGPLKGFPDQPA